MIATSHVSMLDLGFSYILSPDLTIFDYLKICSLYMISLNIILEIVLESNWNSLSNFAR